MKNRHIISLLILLMIISNGLYTQVKKGTNVAVLDFEGTGISTSEAVILSDRFRSELVNTKIFIIVERGKMVDILNEIGFQQTGCTSSECLLEVGHILNVQHMFGGSIGKIGTVYSLDIRMINVQTGSIDNVISKTYKGPREGLLSLIKEIALQFAGKKSDKAQESRIIIAEEEKQKHEEEKEHTIDKKKGNKYWLVPVAAVVAAGIIIPVLITQKEQEEQQLDHADTYLPTPPNRPE